MEPWGDEQIKANLPPVYHFLYDKVRNEYIQPDEKIFIGAYCCRSEWNSPDTSKFLPLSAVSTISGVVFISSYRYFRTGYRYNRGAFIKGDVVGGRVVAYRKRGREWLNLDSDLFARWVWILPLAEPEKGAEEFVTEMPLSSLSEIRGRQEYTVDDRGQRFDIVEIEFEGGVWLAFSKADGNRVYELLQAAKKNNGKMISSDTVSRTEMASRKPGLAEQLTKLASLYREGVLTKEEFEAAKGKLLA